MSRRDIFSRGRNGLGSDVFLQHHDGHVGWLWTPVSSLIGRLLSRVPSSGFLAMVLQLGGCLQEVTMELRGRYKYAIETAKSFGMDGSAEERDGKLYFNGRVQTQEQANKIWDAIKTIPTWQQDVVANIKAVGGGTAPAAGAVTYTVKPGDTLSKIAREQLGNANAYMDIFNANRDQLSDPDKIKPGQTLKIPQVANR
jgi:LysM repeat protein